MGAVLPICPSKTLNSPINLGEEREINAANFGLAKAANPPPKRVNMGPMRCDQGDLNKRPEAAPVTLPPLLSIVSNKDFLNVLSSRMAVMSFRIAVSEAAFPPAVLFNEKAFSISLITSLDFAYFFNNFF